MEHAQQLTLVAMINLFQSSLLAALPGRLNSILFLRTGYPKKKPKLNGLLTSYHSLRGEIILFHFNLRNVVTCYNTGRWCNASVSSYKAGLIRVTLVCRQNLLHLLQVWGIKIRQWEKHILFLHHFLEYFFFSIISITLSGMLPLP